MSRVTLAVKGATPPNENFSTLPVRVLKKCRDYEEARKTLNKATYTSDLQTDAEEETASQRRKKGPTRRFLESESEESETENQGPSTRRQSPRKKKKDATSVPPLPPLPTLSTKSVSPRRVPVTPPRSPVRQRSPNQQRQTLIDKSPCQISTSAIERKTLSLLEEVKAQTHFNTKLLQALMKKVDGVQTLQDNNDEEITEINFPIQTNDNITRAEDLLQSQDFFRKVVRSLSTIGGENLKTAVRRLLNHMIKNSLAKDINWLGKGGKRAFSTLMLNKVLIATIRRNRLCASATDSEIAGVAKDWFRYAKDRDGGGGENKGRKEKDRRPQKQKTKKKHAVKNKLNKN